MSYLSKNKWITGQDSIECLSCNQWVHHDNKTNCSGLTNSEFEIYCNDKNKGYECDQCMYKNNVKTFFTLPFANQDDHDDCLYNRAPLNYDEELFKSLETKKYISQCEFIQYFVNSDNNEDLPTPVNST